MQRHPTTLTVSVGLLLESVADRHRVVAPDDLTEVPGRSQLVVQAAVDDDERLATRDLAVDDTRDVHAALAHDVPPELDHHPCLRKVGTDALVEQHGEVLADATEVEGRVTVEVRDPEATAEIEVA